MPLKRSLMYITVIETSLIYRKSRRRSIFQSIFDLQKDLPPKPLKGEARPNVPSWYGRALRANCAKWKVPFRVRRGEQGLSQLLNKYLRIKIWRFPGSILTKTISAAATIYIMVYPVSGGFRYYYNPFKKASVRSICPV